MTLNSLRIFLIMAIAGALSSCDGIFSDIYDPAPDDDAFEQGIITRSDSPGRYTLMLDARSYNEWHFIHLSDLSITTVAIPDSLSGEWDGRSGWSYHLVEGTKYTPLSSRKTDPQPEPDEWDFALHHFDVRTNGGAALATTYTAFSELPATSASFPADDFQSDVWTNNQVITDLEGMMAYHIGYQNSYANLVLSDWVTMDFSNPPPTYSATGKVYLMRLADGTVAAMLLRNYMSNAGTKGFLTIEIKYPY
ncbi:MAG: HmuY family protein [Bacteroidales bacterium]|nr:HmuY family protein [Bacteroidales bacterium]